MSRSVYPIISSQRTLPFYLTGIGYSEPEYHVVRKNGLFSHQFLTTLSGSGVLRVGGSELPQQSGSVFYLPPSLPHEYFPTSDCWSTAWVVFRGQNAAPLMEEMGFDGVKYAADSEACGEELMGIFGKIFSAAGDLLNGGERSSAALYEYILAMRRLLVTGESKAAAMNSIAKKAIIFMDENYMLDISDEMLASLSGVTVQHFCRVFKAETGMRPLEYLAGKRISEAKSLLVNSRLSMDEIATRVGFSGRNYLGIVFRRIEGMSPTHYRKTKG